MSSQSCRNTSLTMGALSPNRNMTYLVHFSNYRTPRPELGNQRHAAEKCQTDRGAINGWTGRAAKYREENLLRLP
jgi:hypothetical protein